MAYIGKQPIVGNFQICDAISVVNGQAAYTMQVASTNVSPESANHMLVSLNGVLQKPGSSFTVSGATITFASNLVTNDVIDFIILLGDALNLGTPSDGTVATAKIAANAVTAAKFNADVISGQTALAAEPADTDEFLVSDAGVLKRIDYSLIKAAPTHVLLSTATLSSSASEILVTSGIDSTYKSYMIDIINLHPATDNKSLNMQFRQGGSTITSSIYDYGFTHISSGGADTHNYTHNDPQMNLANNINTDATSGVSGRIFLYEPSNTTYDTRIQWGITFELNGDEQCHASGSGRIESTTAVDGFRLFMSSGDIDLCTAVKLYGIT